MRRILAESTDEAASLSHPFGAPSVEVAPPCEEQLAAVKTRFPDSQTLQHRIRSLAEQFPFPGDGLSPPSTETLEACSVALLNGDNLSLEYTGWAAAQLLNKYHEKEFRSAPLAKRLLLVPQCMHSLGTPSSTTAVGTNRPQGASTCQWNTVISQAESLGYQVAVVSSASDVFRALTASRVDAILGVAPLEVLEGSFEKFNALGIPSIVTPIRYDGCCHDAGEVNTILDALRIPFDPRATPSISYVNLMRSAAQLFHTEALQPLLSGLGHSTLANPKPLDFNDPLTGTSALACDFLAQGGKYSRPFITLAVFDALTGSKLAPLSPDDIVNQLPSDVLHVAMSIEVFHKASLIHDDIEDNDDFRYGREAMHKRCGTPAAINVGDYLIGLGYRLVSREIGVIGALPVAQIVDSLAGAHMRLAEGQGAELLWRNAESKSISPESAIRVYELKTAPAFEAALCSGFVLARAHLHEMEEAFEAKWSGLRSAGKEFARLLGTAFQILNDLKDWRENEENKVRQGGDVLGGRPTLLLAIALENLDRADQSVLLNAVNDNAGEANARLATVRKLYEKADVFTQAEALVAGYRLAAQELASEIEPLSLRALFRFLVRAVLAN